MRAWTVLALLAVMLIGSATAAQEGDIQIAVTSPIEGETISGVVSVEGSADHPSQFAAYQLWFAPAGTELWFPITGPVQLPVREAQLSEWDTAELPEGEYRLRLQVFLGDGTLAEVFVENLQVVQSAEQENASEPPATSIPPTEIPVPLNPAIEEAPVAAPAEVLPTAPPSENVPVELVDTLPSSPEQPPLDVSSAFCTGALIGGGVFMVMGIYTILRSRLKKLL